MLKKYFKKKNNGLIVISVMTALFIVFILCNQWRKNKSKIVKQKVLDNSVGQVQEDLGGKDLFEKSNREKKIRRRIREETKRGLYTESVFYLEDKEVARIKEYKGKVLEQKGKIPNGKVEFFNETTKRTGEEHYINGERCGPYLEYYKTGELKKEAEYVFSRITWFKEYYKSGAIRSEQNFQDAIWDSEYSDNKIAGVGKLYLPNGKVLREWDLSISNSKKYMKIYNMNGELKSTNYYSDSGELIE